jgi:hypothetical protein
MIALLFNIFGGSPQLNYLTENLMLKKYNLMLEEQRNQPLGFLSQEPMKAVEKYIFL